MVDSDVLRALRDRGRKGGERRLACFEWEIPTPAPAPPTAATTH